MRKVLFPRISSAIVCTAFLLLFLAPLFANSPCNSAFHKCVVGAGLGAFAGLLAALAMGPLVEVGFVGAVFVFSGYAACCIEGYVFCINYYV